MVWIRLLVSVGENEGEPGHPLESSRVNGFLGRFASTEIGAIATVGAFAGYSMKRLQTWGQGPLLVPLAITLVAEHEGK